MSTKKIEDDKTWLDKPCRHPEHDPPNMRVWEPGRYVHTCPSCGKETHFTVPLVSWRTP